MRLSVRATVIALLLAGPAGAAGKPSFEDLVANLKSPNVSTRVEAAAALGKSRRREAVTPLAALVRDPESRVRLQVIRSLRELRDLAAVAAIVTSLGDGERAVREEAVGSLVELYTDRERVGPVGRFLEMFSDEFDRTEVLPQATVDPAAHRALAAALRDAEPGIREQAALALGILDGRSQLPALIAALRDPDDGVRAAAATAIGKIGTAQDGRNLIPLLADEAGGVRSRVLHALGVLKVKDAGPALRQMFEIHRRKELGVRVLAALSRIADPAQTDLFHELMQDADPERRRLAVEGLARVSDGTRLAAFKKDYQRESNPELRLAYTFALTRLGDRAFVDTVVLTLPSRTLGTRSRDYLMEMGPDILPDLYPYLSDPDEEVRAALCDVIAQMGDTDAISRLAPLVSDPSQKVADRANQAVERLRRVQAAKAAS